jgi:hypothetical protein
VTPARRSYPWGEIAEMARQADGRWRLHRSLVAVGPHILVHARRRVPELKPTTTHTYEFARGAVGRNDLGETVFDLFIRWVPKGTDP